MTATSDYIKMQEIATSIVRQVEEKGKAYGDSWRARGGAGAFMVMARKWDRIENICRGEGWDIFDALDGNKEDVRDDVRDLIGYLLLILEHTAPFATRVGIVEGRHPLAPWASPQTTLQSLTTASNEHWTNEGYYGDDTELYKCRACGATQRHRGTPAQPHGCEPL